MPPHFLLACPLPSDLFSGAKLGVGTPFAQTTSSEKLGVKVWWLLNTMGECRGRRSSLVLFSSSHPDSTWDNSNSLYCVFARWYIFPFHANAFTSCLWYLCGKLRSLTPHSFVALFPLLTFIQHVSQMVQSTIFREKLLCPGYLAGPRREFRDE